MECWRQTESKRIINFFAFFFSTSLEFLTIFWSVFEEEICNSIKLLFDPPGHGFFLLFYPCRPAPKTILPSNHIQQRLAWSKQHYTIRKAKKMIKFLQAKEKHPKSHRTEIRFRFFFSWCFCCSVKFTFHNSFLV